MSSSPITAVTQPPSSWLQQHLDSEDAEKLGCGAMAGPPGGTLLTGRLMLLGTRGKPSWSLPIPRSTYSHIKINAFRIK